LITAKKEDWIDYDIFVTPGLGDNSYLITSGGEAVIVDPQRDAWRLVYPNSWPITPSTPALL
jgi:hypothetical protein